jgi:hypothetical protein
MERGNNLENVKEQMEASIIQRLNKPNPSNQDIGKGLLLIVEKMWSEERLAEFVKGVHEEKCKDCPHKVRHASAAAPVESDGDQKGQEKLSGKMLALIGSLVTAVVTLAGVVVKLALGG